MEAPEADAPVERPIPAGASDGRRRLLVFALIVLAGAAAVRFRGAANDLWLDEIWSVQASREVAGPWHVFTSLHHEINHYLNTLWIYWLGLQESWLGYRLPSLVAGVGSVVMAGLIGARRSRTDALMAIVVFGFSYVLVLYSSEARGYSTAFFFALSAYYLLQRFLHENKWVYAVAFSLCQVGGLLSHLTFVNVMAATAVWAVCHDVLARRKLGQIAGRVLLCHALPWAVLATLYLVDIRFMQTGGGSASSSLIDAYGSALAWCVGTTTAPGIKLLSLIAGVTFLAAALRLLERERESAWIFFVLVIIVCPALLVVTRGSEIVYARHFMVGVVFLLLLMSHLFAALYLQAGRRRMVGLLLLGVFLAVNAASIHRLFRDGRGVGPQCIRFMDENTGADEVVTVGSDQDFRAFEVLRFYGAHLKVRKTISYFNRGSWPKTGVTFLIVQREGSEPAVPPAENIDDEAGRSYRLVKSFPVAPLAGMHWFVYRNLAR